MPAIWIPKRLVEIGLINTAAQNPASFVSHCESEYAGRVHAAAKEYHTAKSKIIMLTGPSASGKTTTANKLAKELTETGTPAVVVSLDDFYRDLEQYPRLPDGSKDYENVNALDMPEIHRCLLQLIETGSADFPEFDFKIETRKKERRHIALNDGVVVVEGIHALNPMLTEVLPVGSVYKIYAGLREEYSYRGQRSIPTRDVRLARRMVRDSRLRGHDVQKTLAMWPKVCDGEDRYIKAFKPQADLLLDTSFSYEICVMAPFITQMYGTLGTSIEGQMLNDLANRFETCTPMDAALIPEDSMLREFIG